MKEMTRKEIETILEGKKVRQGWQTGVKQCAFEILGHFDEEETFPHTKLEKKLLNGADSWEQYSYGGCALIYDYDIAKIFCTEKGFERCDHGAKKIGTKENWLDVQARGLREASRLIKSILEK